MTATVRLETDFIDWSHFCWQVTCLKTGMIIGSGGGHQTEEDAQVGGLEFVASARGRQEAERIAVGLAGDGWTE